MRKNTILSLSTIGLPFEANLSPGFHKEHSKCDVTTFDATPHPVPPGASSSSGWRSSRDKQ